MRQGEMEGEREKENRRREGEFSFKICKQKFQSTTKKRRKLNQETYPTKSTITRWIHSHMK